MDLPDFCPEIINDKLKKEGRDGHFSITIVDFIFSEAVQDVVKEFDKKFSSKKGGKAFPRTMLLGILMYCYKEGETNISRMVKRCRTDRILRIITRGKTPSYATLKRFIKDYNTKAFKKVFLHTLVELNDLDLLKFLHLFVDGTDAIIRGSRFYKISRKELEALKLLKKHGLLLKNNEASCDNWQKKVNKRINEGVDENTVKLLNIALKNPRKFTKHMAREIHVFEEAFEETEKDYLCVVFPQANLMPTKKGRYEFAFNLQQIMNENNIVIGSVLLNKPNDYHSIEEVIRDLRENFQLLAEMVDKYGCRNNLKEIQRLLDDTLFIMDAGYFSDFNLEKADEYGIKVLIMPKSIAIEKNHEFRKRKGMKNNKKNEKSFKKKDFKRVYNGYICPKGNKLELEEVKKINSTKNMEKDVPEHLIKKSHIHVCHSCSQCPLKEKCIGDKDRKTIIDIVSPLSYEMTNKFTNKTYLKIYSPRFQVSESINGFLKTQNGVLLLSGSDINEISNEMHLRNAVYNLIRKNNLKDTLY
jgi:hypothetical protein